MDKLTSYIQMEKILASNLSHKWWLIAYYQCLEILMPKHIPCYILFYWHFFRFTGASAQSHQCKFLQISAEITVRSHGDKSSMHALELTADLKPVFLYCKNEGFLHLWMEAVGVFYGEEIVILQACFCSLFAWVHLLRALKLTYKQWFSLLFILGKHGKMQNGSSRSLPWPFGTCPATEGTGFHYVALLA